MSCYSCLVLQLHGNTDRKVGENFKGLDQPIRSTVK